LVVSDRISEATKSAGAKASQDIGLLLEESFSTGVLRRQAPEFVATTMESLAEMTLDFITREPNRLEDYKHAGFETLWNAISKR
jgi:hypothetical protein